MRRRGLLGSLLLLAFASLLTLPCAARADPASMKPKEYELWIQYQNALEDPRVVKKKPKRRIPAIAKNRGWPVAELRAAIAKGEKFGAGIVAENQAAAQKAAKDSKVGDRVTSVELVEVTGVVIGFASWEAKDKDRLAHDAVYLARALSQAAPLAKTWALWACMGKKKVWSGLVEGTAGAGMRRDIERYHPKMYLGAFSDLYNVFEGKPPLKQKRDPKTGEPMVDPETGKKLMEPDPDCE